MAVFTATKTEKSVKKVSNEIRNIYARRESAVFALALSYAIKIINEFRKNQAGNKYWTNRTQQAFQRVFSEGFKDSVGIGFFIAHGISYGIYLELANSRRNEALRPLIVEFAAKFLRDIKIIYGKG